MDGTSISKHIYDFLKFLQPYEIHNEEYFCVVFFPTLEGRANWWCYTFPPAFFHSLIPFLKELHQAFGKYNYRDVCGGINLLRMEPNESLDKFFDQFLNLYYEILKEDFN